jgi:hypothetical protein
MGFEASSASKPIAFCREFACLRGFTETNLLLDRHRERASIPTTRAMCEKCAELDKKIEHYRQLSSLITDQKAVDAIALLIEKLRAEKTALHPEVE